MMLDIETLRVIWWMILGVLLIGFAITDGFDIGAAILMPLIARTDMEKRIILNAIGPVWEGNQVWIILGAGAALAAWPFVYAVAFSGFYFLILFLLLTMGISRPVSFKYRSKLPNQFWRNFWDAIVFIGGFFPALCFGLLMGNVMLGAPFYFDNDLRVFYSGTFTALFTPFALWCALTSLFMLSMHGGIFLAIKTEQGLRDRAIFCARVAAALMIVCFAVGGYWIAYGVTGYQVVAGVDPAGFSNPLHKHVVPLLGAWMQNYHLYPVTMLLPALGFIGAFGVLLSARLGGGKLAFICSSLAIVGVIGTVGVSIFPFLLPSSVNLSASLLVWDASSSQLTLMMMLAAVIIFLPIVLLYTSWVYYVLRGKVTPRRIDQERGAY